MPGHPEPTRAPIPIAKLPDRPDPDQLKKQAKALQRAFADGKPEAGATVRRHFHAKPGQPLTLAQAQLVLARSYGYESWPKLKAFADGVTRQRLVEAVNAGDTAQVRSLLRRRPEMAGATTGQGEQQLIHLAVINDDEPMVRLLVELGADPRRGIWPHRESTSAHTMAAERGLDHLVRAIQEVEAERRDAMRCPNTAASPEQETLAGLIRAGRNEEAIAMLEADPALMKQCDRDGATPLHVAAACANAGLVDWLCDHRADARKRDLHGQTPIDRAVLGVGWRVQARVETALRVMHRLKQRGCDTTPIAAAAMGDVDALRQIPPERIPRLTAEGGNVFGNRGALLTRAVQFDQGDAVECLLDMGLDVNEPIPLGKASDDEHAVSWGGPIWNAAAFGRHKIAKLLLGRGADPNANVYASGWPLDRAYERGDRAMIDLLIAYGGRPTAYTLCGAHDVQGVRREMERQGDDVKFLRELVWSAALVTSLPIVRLALPQFISAGGEGAEPGQLHSWHDILTQPMRMAGPNHNTRPEGYADEDRYQIMAMLIAAAPDVNATGRFGLTLLHFAAAREMPEAQRCRFVAQLLDAGADPSRRDQLLCSTALGWACRYGREATVELLLSRGVPAAESAAPAWAQPVAWAQKMGHDAIADRLRGAGAAR